MGYVAALLERIRTPLTLAALVIIVLYAIFKAVVALDIFESIGSQGTLILIGSVINKLFYLALVAIVLSVGAYVFSLFVSTDHSKKTNAEQEFPFTSLSQQLANIYARRISDWLSTCYAQLQKYTEHSDLKTNTKSRHAKILPKISQEVHCFPGGIYTLDQNGVVIHQATPYFPEMPNITGYAAGHKEYFIECQRKQKPVICNSFTSANRKEEILVIAIPRYDTRGTFIGILDAVIDLSSSPFSEMADSVVADITTATFKGKRVNLYLLDKRHVVLGSNNDRRIGRTLGGNTALERTLKGSDDAQAAGYGAVASVNGTPFITFAYWE